jgi:hypothetical protein
MRKIVADTHPLAKTLECGAIDASFQVIEAEMAMDEVAEMPDDSNSALIFGTESSGMIMFSRR